MCISVHKRLQIRLQILRMETRFYLDKRAGKDGKNIPLKVAIASCHKTALLATGVKLELTQWNATTQKVIDHPERRELNKRLGMFKSQVDEIIDRLLMWERINPSDLVLLKRRIEEELDPEKRGKHDASKLFYNRFVQFAQTRPAEGTRRIYMVTARRMRDFYGDKIDTMTFEDVTIDWLNKFNDFLALTAPKRNARNIHFRNIRAVVRQALDDEITRKNDIRKLDMTPEATAKRSLSVEDLRVIFDFPVEPWAEIHRDMFKLMFMLAGINTVDLCNLKEIVNGRIEYTRQKTHKPVSLRVEPEALEIINRYRGENWLVRILDNICRSTNYTIKINLGLKSIGNVTYSGRGHKKTVAPLFPFLTPYWARHTWATIACDLDIPVEVIGRAMGHSGNTVTHIYIRYNEKKSDEANRKVLDWVLYGKINGEEVVKPGTKEFYGEKADIIMPLLGLDLEPQPTPEPPKRKRGRPRKTDK